MKLTEFTLLVSIILIFSCRKNSSVPSCIQTQINTFKIVSCDHGPSVKEYLFQGKTVYLFTDGTCYSDAAAELIDQNCITLGSLGGISGNTKINGVEFSTAVYKRTVWSRP